MIYLENENLEELKKSGKVIVDFYADWCGPCKMIGSVLEEISIERKDIKIIKVNVDKHEDIASHYQIMMIPKILVYRDGQEINNLTGFVPKEEILKGLD